MPRSRHNWFATMCWASHRCPLALLIVQCDREYQPVPIIPSIAAPIHAVLNPVCDGWGMANLRLFMFVAFAATWTVVGAKRLRGASGTRDATPSGYTKL